MTKSRPTNVNQRLPRNVRLSQMKALPSGTANFIRDIATHDPKCRVLVSMAKQTTDARGKMRFRIKGFVGESFTTRLAMRCEGFEHSVVIVSENSVAHKHMVTFLRGNSALEYDATHGQMPEPMKCTRCKVGIRGKLSEDLMTTTGRTRVAHKGEKLCNSCKASLIEEADKVESLLASQEGTKRGIEAPDPVSAPGRPKDSTHDRDLGVLRTALDVPHESWVERSLETSRKNAGRRHRFRWLRRR